jgi:predicted nucleic acid-binding protein
MKNIQREFRVFLDTSALLSGLNSPLGASGYIISLFKLGKISIVISPEVIEEVQRVIPRKFPLLRVPFLDFLASGPVVTKELTKQELKKAYDLLRSEDAPIFAGAIKGRVSVLITLDKNFQKIVKKKTPCKVLLPGEFLQKYGKKFRL